MMMYQRNVNFSLAVLPERKETQGTGLAPLHSAEMLPPRPVVSLPAILRSRYKYLIFCGIISAVVGVLAAKKFAQGTWSYSSEVLHQPIAGDASGFAPMDNNTLRGMVKSQDVLEQLKSEFELGCPLSVLDKSFEVESPNGGKAIVIKLSWSDPKQAELMLDRLTSLFVEKVDRVRHQALVQLGQDYVHKADLAREELLKAQDHLAELCESLNVLDFEKELSALHDGIGTLELDLRKQRAGLGALLRKRPRSTTCPAC